MADPKLPKRRGGGIPRTWLGGFLQAWGGPKAKWKELLQLLLALGAEFPDLADYSLQAQATLKTSRGATPEEILDALNVSREGEGKPGLSGPDLVGQMAKAGAWLSRDLTKLFQAFYEPKVMQALGAAALKPKNSSDRRVFLETTGLLVRGGGVNVNVDNRRVEFSKGIPGVEEDNLEYQRLMTQGPRTLDVGEE